MSKLDPTGRPTQFDMFSAGTSPVMAACGMGVDSVAMIIEMVERGERIDVVLFADTGSEKPATIAYVEIFRAWLEARGITFHVVGYQPKKFKNWPPYGTLEENCITNGTLPSIAFGFGSCSLKWKVAPQNNWTESWEPARTCWAAGGRVTKLIGYDCSPADIKRYAEREGYQDDPKYTYRYPLREWGWVRADCEARIARAGLPVPVKSACFFCTAMKPHEVDALEPHFLRRIVLMEARAKPRLTSSEGLWRKTVKGNRGGYPKPGSMTEYIRSEGLLPSEQIDWIIEHAPKQLIAWQEGAATVPVEERTAVREWLAFFDAMEGGTQSGVEPMPRQEAA
jgi:hypothetical protein